MQIAECAGNLGSVELGSGLAERSVSLEVEEELGGEET